MLQLSESLTGRPVLSLRTGGRVATTRQVIINPNNLKVEGFYCDDSAEKRRQPVLLAQDIRDVLPQGLVVNDYEVLCDADELVRLKPVLEIDFTLAGKLVVTDTKRKIGKVDDYATDIESMYIQKIYVTQSLVRNFSTAQISIDRSQIVEITNRQIVVQEPAESLRAPAAAGALAG